jgi:hypothetical protein
MASNAWIISAPCAKAGIFLNFASSETKSRLALFRIYVLG